MPSMAPLLAPPTPPTQQPAPSAFVPPAAQPLSPRLAPAPTLAAASAPTLSAAPPAPVIGTPTAAIGAPTLPSATPTSPSAPSVPHPHAAGSATAPEPDRLTAALDAAGAPVVRPAPTVSRRLTQAQRARKKRVKRIKRFVVLVVLAAGALFGPTLVRWVADQVGGGSDPIAPNAPTEVIELTDDAG
jgi:hypothetical protein